VEAGKKGTGLLVQNGQNIRGKGVKKEE